MTLHAPEGAKAAIETAIGDRGRVVYLDDAPRAERGELLRESEALLAWDLQTELRDEEWDCLAHLKLVQFLDAGIDGAPLARLPSTTLVASNAGAYADAVAEHALALVLALAKRLPLRHEELSEGRFDAEALSLGLHGRICAILGFGGIGRSVARVVRALGMRVFIINRSGTTSEPVDFAGTLDDLEYVLHEAAVIVIALPLTIRTKNLIGARELHAMQPDAILVNVARAGIIRQDVLYQHLRLGPCFMAGLDVWWGEPYAHRQFDCEYPFLSLPNVIGTAHVASNVEGWFESGVAQAAHNVRRYLEGEQPAGVVCRDEYET